MTHDLERPLIVLALLALRVVPSLGWIAWSARSTALALLLGFGASLCLLPLALRITPTTIAADTALVPAALRELTRGVTLGLGGLLPALALAWAGRLSDALRDADTSVRDAWMFPLERLYGVAAIAVTFASGAHVVVFGALASSLLEVPLGSGIGEHAAVQTVFLELGKLLARALTIGVVLAAPVVLVVTTAALTIGLVTRASAPIGGALLRGPLLPMVGLSAACLSISGILGEYPRLAQVFVDATFALLMGLR